jgi:hypothetical protein
MAGCPGSRARLQLGQSLGQLPPPSSERSRRCRTACLGRLRRRPRAHEPAGRRPGCPGRRGEDHERRRQRPAGCPRPARRGELIGGRRRRLEGPGQRGLPGPRSRAPDEPRPGRRHSRPGRGRPVRAVRPPGARPVDLGPRPAPRRQRRRHPRRVGVQERALAPELLEPAWRGALARRCRRPGGDAGGRAGRPHGRGGSPPPASTRRPCVSGRALPGSQLAPLATRRTGTVAVRSATEDWSRGWRVGSWRQAPRSPWRPITW